MPIRLVHAILIASFSVALCNGCASPLRAEYQSVALSAPTQEAALAAAKRALARNYEGVRSNRRGTVVLADPLYVDFGQTELDAVATALEQPGEVGQALGRVRRIPSIRVKKDDGAYTFEIKVQREIEDLESGYVAYDTPYDSHEASSMPTDPSAYSGMRAPPRAEWIPQGNDVLYEGQLRRVLAEELGATQRR